MGVVGAGIATVISWFIYLFLGLYYAKKEFNITIYFKNLWKPLIAGIIMSSILFMILKNLAEVTILSGMSIILLGVFVYFISLYLLKGVKKEDLSLLSLLKRESTLPKF
jgi:Na+-driven multidrug efflux pump